MYFKNKLKHSKRSDQVTDDVMSFLGHEKKNYQVKYYFPANFHCIKYALCFKLDHEMLLQQQKTLIQQ